MFQIFARAFSDSLGMFDTGLKVIGLTVLAALVTAVIVLVVRGWQEFKKHVVQNIFIAFGGAVTTWLLVFTVILVRLPAKMLAESNANLTNVIEEKRRQSITINSLADKNEKQRQQIKDLEQAGPRVITRTLPPTEEPRKCWINQVPNAGTPLIGI